MEEWVRANTGVLTTKMRTEGRSLPSKFRFRLVSRKEGLYALDADAKVAIPLPRPDAG